MGMVYHVLVCKTWYGELIKFMALKPIAVLESWQHI
jgi:hypothetical protein